jgi:hypothetical protein
MTPNVNLMGSFYTPSSKKWSFYSSADCNNDYLRYVDKGGKAGECLDYLGYAGNPEKSSGAFSSDGLLTAQEKSEIRKELKTTKSCVWDYVVSFEEGYGKSKIRSWRDAQVLIAEEFPKFLKANGMDASKVRWFAGLHENTDNRHIHLCFYEKEPERIVAHQSGRRWHRGKMSQSSIESFKVRVEQTLSSGEFALGSERRALMDGLGDALDEKTESDRKAKKALLNLYRVLPPGDFGYSSKEADPIRQDIDAVTAAVIQSEPALSESFDRFIATIRKKDEETKAICERDKIDSQKYLIAETMVSDFYRRAGNRVLAYVRKPKGRERKPTMTKTEWAYARHREKAGMYALVNNVLNLVLSIAREEREEWVAFDEFEQEMREMDWEREKEKEGPEM